MDAAPEKELIVHVASHHADRAADYNEENTGLGLRLRKAGERLALAGGFYRNSIRNETIYGGVAYDLAYAGPATFRILGLVGTGYSFPLIPVAVPELALSWKGYGVAVNYLPGIWALSLSARF